MKRYYCDRCGEELVNFRAVVSARIDHHTNRLEVVDCEESRDAELCSDCFDLANEILCLVMNRPEYVKYADLTEPVEQDPGLTGLNESGPIYRDGPPPDATPGWTPPEGPYPRHP